MRYPTAAYQDTDLVTAFLCVTNMLGAPTARIAHSLFPEWQSRPEWLRGEQVGAHEHDRDARDINEGAS